MIIDLSLPLHPSLPVYPGDHATTFVQRQTFEHDGYTAHQVTMSCHAGTHVDAPLHAVPGGSSIEHADILNACVGEAVLIPVSSNGNIEIMPSHLEQHENYPPGSRIILKTGWSSRYGENGYYHDHPSISDALATLMIEQKVALIGIDTPSVHHAEGPCHDIHHKLLEAGIVIIENLAHLDLIPSSRFFLSAAPLRFDGLDGSPTRAYAIIQQ